MPFPVLRCLVFAFSVMVTACKASRIIFLVKSTEVIDGKGSTFTLWCALENEDGKENFVNVTSFTIRKTEDSIQGAVATIVPGLPSGVDAKVTGNFSSQHGHVLASFFAPKLTQAGTYACEITAVDKAGVKSNLTSFLTVNIMSISDLLKRIAQYEDDIVALKKTDKDLRANISRLALRHSEAGFVSCNKSDEWGEPFESRETVRDVHFSVPYTQIPVVTLGLRALDVDQKNNIRILVQVRDLTTSGFKIVCRTWWRTLVNLANVQWFSTDG